MEFVRNVMHNILQSFFLNEFSFTEHVETCPFLVYSELINLIRGGKFQQLQSVLDVIHAIK